MHIIIKVESCRKKEYMIYHMIQFNKKKKKSKKNNISGTQFVIFLDVVPCTKCCGRATNTPARIWKVLVSAQRPAILIEIFHGFSQSLQLNALIVP
jgi:hypothetical protein